MVKNVRGSFEYDSYNFVLEHTDGSLSYISSIDGINGSLYTVCVRKQQRNNEEMYITYKNIIGVFKRNNTVRLISYSYSGPSIHCINNDKVEDCLIKYPDETVHTDVPVSPKMDYLRKINSKNFLLIWMMKC